MLEIGALQLEYGTMLTQLIIFIVLFWLVKRYAMKPLMKVLNDRQSHIENQISSAEEANKQATKIVEEQKQALQDARKAAHEMLEQAKATSSKQADQILADSRKEATRIKDEAMRDIETEKNKAIAALKSQVSAMSVMIASKIIEKQVDEKSQEQLIEKYLKEVGGNL
jgi:F-type H+-transporting ATPase subunit b